MPPKASHIYSELKSMSTAKAAFIEPMLLLRAEALPEGAEWIFELNLDGYRALAVKTIAAQTMLALVRTRVQERRQHRREEQQRFPEPL